MILYIIQDELKLYIKEIYALKGVNSTDNWKALPSCSIYNFRTNMINVNFNPVSIGLAFWSKTLVHVKLTHILPFSVFSYIYYRNVPIFLDNYKIQSNYSSSKCVIKNPKNTIISIHQFVIQRFSYIHERNLGNEIKDDFQMD